MQRLKRIAILIAIIVIAVPTPAAAFSSITNEIDTFVGKKAQKQAQYAQDELLKEGPALQIIIPGLRFASPDVIADEIRRTTGEDDDQYIVIPYIGEYIVSLYRYGIVAIGVVAVVMIIVSGLQWMIPSGSDNINQAKERIGRSIIGLLLAVSSYLILYIINPALVNFQFLKVLAVKGVPAEDLVYEDRPINFDPTSVPGNPNLFVGKGNYAGISRKKTDTTFDPIFKEFGNCSLKVNYKYLRAVAYSESSLNPTLNNYKMFAHKDPRRSFVGLFQAKTKSCNAVLKQYPAWNQFCKFENLTDPYLSTAIGYRHIAIGLSKLKDECGSRISDDLKIVAGYLSVNYGPWYIHSMLKKNYISETDLCDYDKHRAAALKWGNKTYKGNGTAKVRYAEEKVLKVAKELNVGNIFNSGGNGSVQCPLDADGSKLIADADALAANVPKSFKCDDSFAGKKMLALGDSITAEGRSYARQIGSNCQNLLTITVSARVGDSSTEIRLASENHDMTEYDYVSVLGGINNIGSEARVKKDLISMYKRAKAEGAKVIGITITPYGNYKTANAQRNQNVQSINSWIKAGAPDPDDNNKRLLDHIIDANTLLADKNDPTKLNRAFDSSDGLHPNAAGQTAIAFELAKTVFKAKAIE